jgi:hypothetical protein
MYNEFGDNMALNRNETKFRIIKFINEVKGITFQYFGDAKMKEFEKRFREEYVWSDINMSLARKLYEKDLDIALKDKNGKYVSSSKITGKYDLLWVLQKDIELDEDNINNFVSTYYTWDVVSEEIVGLMIERKLYNIVDMNGVSLKEYFKL